MPTILRANGFRFFIYSNEHLPLHIHVERGGATAKFNLEPLELVKSNGFKAQELKQIREIVDENLQLLREKWNE